MLLGYLRTLIWGLGMKRFAGALFFAALALGGCASMNARLMPSEISITTFRCRDYEEAKTVYESLELYKTTLEDLRKTCLDPGQSNTNIISASAVPQMFLPSPAIKMEDLPSGVQDCLRHLQFCKPYELFVKKIEDKGIDNFTKRALKCKRKNQATGPDAGFRLFLVNGLLVFKEDFGRSHVDIVSEKKNPLCLLQEPADIILKYTPTP